MSLLLHLDETGPVLLTADAADDLIALDIGVLLAYAAALLSLSTWMLRRRLTAAA